MKDAPRKHLLPFIARMSLPTSVLTSLLSMFVFFSCSSPLIPDDNGDNPSNGDTSDSIPSFPGDSVTVIHTGAEGDPYTVAEAQWISATSAVWVEGYVVGTVKGSLTNGCTFEPPFSVESNILIADTFPCSPSSCLPVELPSGSLVQYALNLVDNPSLLHEKRRLKGDITTYFRTAGLRNVSVVTAIHDDDTPSDSTSTTSNTIDAPFNVGTAIALQTGASGSAAFDPNMMYWVRGYIVGWSSGKNRVEVVDSAAQCASALTTNVLLADSIGETSPEHLLVVKLPDGCVREDINLLDHPSNLHHALTVMGHLNAYNGLPGCVDILGASRRTDAAGHPLYRLE